jgi:hypothetical protein
VIPLRRAFAAFLGRETPHPIMPAKWLHGGAVDGEHVSVSRIPFVLARNIEPVVKDLNFDSSQKWNTWRGDGTGPK